MVFRIKVKMDERFKDSMREHIEKVVDNTLNDVADYIGAEADRILRNGDDDNQGSFDTGFLANSLVIDKDTFLDKTVGYSANYGIYIEYGTKPHHPPILPIYSWLKRKQKDLDINIKNKKTITLKDGNTYNVELLSITMAIIKNMEKYGTEAKPFLRPAFLLGKDNFKKLFKKNI